MDSWQGQPAPRTLEKDVIDAALHWYDLRSRPSSTEVGKTTAEHVLDTACAQLWWHRS